MALDYMRGTNSRCPNLLLVSLLLVCLFLACSWWSLTSQNYELLTQVTSLEEQLKINGEELDKCLLTKRSLDEKSRDIQSGAAHAQVQLDKLLSEQEELRESLTRTQEELREAKKKASSLESSLTFKNTELESLKALSEAKNKSLEALRTEKKTLSARLLDEEEKVSSLRREVASLKSAKTSSLVNIVQGGAVKTIPDSPAMDHDAQAAEDENKAAEVKIDTVQEPENKENDSPVPDPREVAMGQLGQL